MDDENRKQLSDWKSTLDFIYSQMTDKLYVLTSENALYMAGIYTGGYGIAQVYTSYPKLKDMHVAGRIKYYYVEDEDSNFTKPHIYFPNILVPTPERALIDCIRYDMEFVDEGAFCEALERYSRSKLDFNYDLLLEVGEFYKVSKEKIDYWLKECEGSVR